MIRPLLGCLLSYIHKRTMMRRTMVKWNNGNEQECHRVHDGVCLEYVIEEDRVIDSVGECTEYWLDRVGLEYWGGHILSEALVCGGVP